MNDFLFEHIGPSTGNVYVLKSATATHPVTGERNTTYSTEVRSPQGESIGNLTWRLRPSAALGDLLSEFVRREGWGLNDSEALATLLNEAAGWLLSCLIDCLDTLTDEVEND